MKKNKRKIKVSRKDLERLIFVYENCNIINNKTIREKLRPTIDKIWEAFNPDDETPEDYSTEYLDAMNEAMN